LTVKFTLKQQRKFAAHAHAVYLAKTKSHYSISQDLF
jgi:hypothetical protein